MTFNIVNMGRLFYGAAVSTAADREKQFSAKEQALEALAKRVGEVQNKSTKRKGETVKENDFPDLGEFISAIDEMEQYSRDSRTNCIMLGIFFNLTDPRSRGEMGECIQKTISILETSANRIDQMILRVRKSIEHCLAVSSETSRINPKTKPMQLMNMLPSFMSRTIAASSDPYPRGCMVGEGVPVDTTPVMASTAFPDWSMSSSSSSLSSSSFSSSSFEMEPSKKEHKSRKKQRSLKGRVREEDVLEPGRVDSGIDHKERRRVTSQPAPVPLQRIVPAAPMPGPGAAPPRTMCGGRFKHLVYPCAHRQR